MSILITQGTTAPLTVSGFFPAHKQEPVTICGFVKASTVSSSFSFSIPVEIASPDRADAYQSRFYSTSDNIYMGLRLYGFGTFESAVNTMTASEAATWLPFACVFESVSSRKTYVRLANGSMAVATDTSPKGTAETITDLVVMDGTWVEGDVKAAYLSVYESALTQVQAEEFFDSAQVAALTPYAKWDATADWGAGTITDSGSSGTNLTPPGGWTFSADNPTLTAAGPDYTNRKGSTLDNVTHGLGTLTTATLNGVNVFDHVSSQAAGTVSFTGAITDEITTSGEYDLVLGDGVGTETYTVQVNVYGVAPSNNPLQKDGSTLASLTGVQVRITAGSDLNGAQLEYLPAATTDASGNLGNIDLSSTAAADTDPVLLHMRTSAGESIIADETVGLI